MFPYLAFFALRLCLTVMVFAVPADVNVSTFNQTQVTTSGFVISHMETTDSGNWEVMRIVATSTDSGCSAQETVNVTNPGIANFTSLDAACNYNLTAVAICDENKVSENSQVVLFCTSSSILLTF